MPHRSTLGWVVPLLLVLQLGLLWIQGVQLHQQNQLIGDLRSDIQDLADSLDSGQDSSQPQDDSDTVPLHHRLQRRPHLQRVATLRLQEDDQDAVAKELQATRDSEKKAVKDAREARSKISIEENARKAEEARKVQGATDTWQRWSWAALGLLGLAWIVRAWLRRR